MVCLRWESIIKSMKAGLFTQNLQIPQLILWYRVRAFQMTTMGSPGTSRGTHDELPLKVVL